jgi:L-fucose isomerase-like protein
MTNNLLPPLTAGYVSFGTMFYEPGNLAMISARAEKQLEAEGIKLVKTAPVYGETTEPERAIRELKAHAWDFLIINIINWVDTRGVFRVLHEFRHEPMVLYSFGGFTDQAGTLISPAAGAGSTSVRLPMQQMGIKFRYLFNGPDTPMNVKGIKSFGKAAQVVKALKRARLGMVGFNDMGLYSTGYNTTRMRNEIGVEVESVDMLQLQKKMDSLKESEVRDAVNEITKNWEYPHGKPKPTVIEKAIRMGVASIRICEEKHFNAFSYKCVEGIDSEMGLTHAIPASIVNSAGYPYVDENDLGNLTVELMLRWLSGNQTMFIEHYEHHPEWILLGEDGYCPWDFVDGKPQIKPVTTVLLDGLVQCSNLKKGRMTLASLAETNEGYQMHIVTGEGRERPQWVEMGVPLPPWPSVKLYSDVAVEQILNNVQSQHFAMTYGHYAEELKNLCYLLSIKVLDDSMRI